MNTEDLAPRANNFVASQNNGDSVANSASAPMVDSKTPRYNLISSRNDHCRAVALPNTINAGDELFIRKLC